MRFHFRPAPSRNFRGFSCKNFLLSCLRASWFIISKFCEAFLNSKTKTYGKVRNITWTVFAIINLYATFRTIASGKSGNSDSAPCIIAIHQHLLIPEKIRNRTYKLIPAWNCCKLALCHLSISINISIYSIRFICPLSTCIPGRQNGIRCSMLPFIMPWFLRMCCLLSSCCCMYSNCCWIDVDVPARALGSFAHFSYLLAKWSNCILNLLRTKCSKLFCNLRSNNRKKNARLLQGKRHSLRITCGSTTLISHHPPGFATRICHMSQCAKCPAGCEETAEVAVTLWAVRRFPWETGCGQWSTPLHATQVAKYLILYLYEVQKAPLNSVSCSKIHRACGTDGKCAIPACWLPQAAWHCLSLGETKTVSDNGTTWMPQKHFLASMKNSARTFMAYVLQRVSVCVCMFVRLRGWR